MESSLEFAVVRRTLPAIAVTITMLIAACTSQGGASVDPTVGQSDPPSQAASGEPSEVPAPTAELVMGIGVDATFGAQIVAVEQGFMEAHGINATNQVFEFGGQTVGAVAAGTIQVGNAGQLSFLAPLSEGAPLVLPATTVITGRSGGVGVLEGISEPEDLVGKSVGAILGSTSELFLSLFFDKYGLSRDDVDVVNIAAPEMVPAMARGDVQAVFVWEPWLTRLQETVEGSSVPWHYEDADFKLESGFVFNRDWVEENPDTADAAIQALIDATEWINENPDEAAEIIAAATRTDVEAIKDQMADLLYTIDLTSSSRQSYEDQIVPFAIEHELIETEDPDALLDAFFYPDVLKRVAPDRTDL